MNYIVLTCVYIEYYCKLQTVVLFTFIKIDITTTTNTTTTTTTIFTPLALPLHPALV